MKTTSTKANLLFGNISLAASSDEIRVTQTPDRSLDGYVIQIALCCGVLLYCALSWRYLPINLRAAADGHSFAESVLSLLGPLVFLFAFSSMMLPMLRPLFGQRETLRFTLTALEIDSFDFGRRWRRRTIPRQKIADVAYDLWGSGKKQDMGLRLFTQKRQIDLLIGLKAVEAQTILEELTRLGYRVSLRDDLPGMVEKEQQRRKFLVTLYE